jgi:hypothetical protein
MPQAQLTVDPHFAVGTRIAGFSVPSSSTSVAVSTTGSTSPATRSPTTMISAPTCSSWPRAGVSTMLYPGGNFGPRVPLGGRDRSQRGSANPPRPGLALDGVQRGGDRRVRRLAREDRQRATRSSGAFSARWPASSSARRRGIGTDRRWWIMLVPTTTRPWTSVIWLDNLDPAASQVEAATTSPHRRPA